MWLEELARKLRISKAQKYIQRGAILCDIGCGKDAFLLNLVKSRLKKGIGIDKKITNGIRGNLEFINLKLEKQIPLPTESVDCLTMLAVLEHMAWPNEILIECFRVLKNGGRLIITTPTPASKLILDFLANRARLLDDKEIGEHVNYFPLSQLKIMLRDAGFKVIRAEKFELGFNNFILAQK